MDGIIDHEKVDMSKLNEGIKRVVDTTYCVIVHDKEHVQHAVLYEDKPSIGTLQELIEELKNDPEFEFTKPVNELFVDLFSYGSAMRILPEEWKEVIKIGKGKLKNG